MCQRKNGAVSEQEKPPPFLAVLLSHREGPDLGRRRPALVLRPDLAGDQGGEGGGGGGRDERDLR